MAESAGTTKGALFHHFDGKQALTDKFGIGWMFNCDLPQKAD
jgi:uncharacterized glyoxalase superfamily protein PhnB